MIQIIPTRESNLYILKQVLPFETRTLGSLETSGEGRFFCTRQSKHVFKKLNALAISNELLKSDRIPFRWIEITLNKTKLITTRNYFIHFGKFWQFQKQGFEAQIFLPIDLYGKDKALSYESLLMPETLFGKVG
jgi:hypothetical protein